MDLKNSVIVYDRLGGVTVSRDHQQCPFAGGGLEFETTDAVTSLDHAPAPAEMRLPGITP